MKELVTLLAEVDVTVELFVVPPLPTGLPRYLRSSTVNFIFGKYLEQRHATEIPNCATRFFFTWYGLDSKSGLEDALSAGCPSRVSLSPLFTKGVPTPAAMTPVERKSFLLLCYASFPNDIDLHLKPKPSTGGTPAERMWGHVYRFYKEMDPVDEEDEELICLVDKLINGANDEYTTHVAATAYADDRDNRFRRNLRDDLEVTVKKWEGTDVKRFTDALYKKNNLIVGGLDRIRRLAERRLPRTR